MRLPDGDGIDLCRDVRSKNPEVLCIILTAHDDDEAVYVAVMAGASGYVLKDMRSGALVDAVRAVANGHQLLDPTLSRMAVKRIATSQPSASAIDTLNTREREILELIAEGMTNRQIGETLALAESLAVFSSPSVLIAVGTRHSTGRRPRRNWSVGARVAGAAEGPVTIIPHPLVGDGNSIVVGVDDPEESASLFAAEEAARTGATLRPVRAWEGPPLWPGRTEHDPAYLESLAEMYRNLVTDAMESILMRYPNLMVNPVVERGIPADVLLEAPKGAWTLVVGNRGFHGLKRFFLGSVSQTVVLQAAVPTVVVNASSAR